MRLGVFSDVHGNDVALEGVLEALAAHGCEALWFLGDVVGYLPGERRCLALLQEAGVRCLQGNHEAMLADPASVDPAREAVYRLADARERLGERGLATLAALPRRAELPGDPAVLLVHGAPDDPLDGRLYPDSDLSGLAGLPFGLVLIGHTHRPFVADVPGGPRVANVGSVGLPRDQGDLSSYAVVDTGTLDVTVHRRRFDLDAVPLGDLHPDTAACLRRHDPTAFGKVSA